MIRIRVFSEDLIKDISIVKFPICTYGHNIREHYMEKWAITHDINNKRALK